MLAGEVLLAVGERGMCICSAGDRSWRGEAWAQGVVGDRLKDLEGFGYGPGKDTRRNRLCKMIASRLGMMRRMVTGDGNGGGRRWSNIRGQGET